MFSDHHKKDTTSFETTSGVYPSPDDADIEDSVAGSYQHINYTS
jgi:hypothetical protein